MVLPGNERLLPLQQCNHTPSLPSDPLPTLHLPFSSASLALPLALADAGELGVSVALVRGVLHVSMRPPLRLH